MCVVIEAAAGGDKSDRQTVAAAEQLIWVALWMNKSRTKKWCDVLRPSDLRPVDYLRLGGSMDNQKRLANILKLCCCHEALVIGL